MDMKELNAGRGWAYFGAILGGVVSVAANVAHSYIPPAGAAPGWQPQPGAVIGAIFWPVALFVGVEILARVVWQKGAGWTFLRFGGMAPVAGVAALVSYRHLSGLLHFYGEDTIVSSIGPAAVDGLMVMASAALLSQGIRKKRAIEESEKAAALAAQLAAEAAELAAREEEEATAPKAPKKTAQGARNFLAMAKAATSPEVRAFWEAKAAEAAA